MRSKRKVNTMNMNTISHWLNRWLPWGQNKRISALEKQVMDNTNAIAALKEAAETNKETIALLLEGQAEIVDVIGGLKDKIASLEAGAANQTLPSELADAITEISTMAKAAHERAKAIADIVPNAPPADPAPAPADPAPATT